MFFFSKLVLKIQDTTPVSKPEADEQAEAIDDYLQVTNYHAIRLDRESIMWPDFSLSRRHKRQIKAQFDLRSLSFGSSKAHGAFGVIAIGKSAVRSEQKFAIKLITPEYKDVKYRATTWRRRVHREAHFLSILRHQNIVEFFGSHMIYERTKSSAIESGVVPRMFAMKCELLDGDIKSLFWGSLASWIDGHDSAGEEQLFRLFARQIGGAVEFVHSHRIVHNDIKAENILYKKLPDGGIIFKLIDFGIAKRYELPRENYPVETSDFSGTKGYFCKQKLMEEPYNPYQADIYSFGLTLAQCKIGFGLTSWLKYGMQSYKKVLRKANQRIGSKLPYLGAICDMLNDDESVRPYIGDVLHLFQ